jgi:hypothetical protein
MKVIFYYLEKQIVGLYNKKNPRKMVSIVTLGRRGIVFTT